MLLLVLLCLVPAAELTPSGAGRSMWHKSVNNFVICISFISGVSLSLRGIPIANNGYVDVDSIGSDDDGALICHTDNTDCCTSTLLPEGDGELGHWYTPGGDNLEDLAIPVEPMASGMGDMILSLVTRGQSLVRLIQVVKLVRVVDLGQFYCEVPDAKGEMQRVYVNLCEL